VYISTHTQHKVCGVTLLAMFTSAACWISFIPHIPLPSCNHEGCPPQSCTEFNTKTMHAADTGTSQCMKTITTISCTLELHHTI